MRVEISKIENKKFCYHLEVITFCAEGLLHFEPAVYYILRQGYYILRQVYYILRQGYYILRQVLHFASRVLHFALVLHFAAVQKSPHINPVHDCKNNYPI